MYTTVKFELIFFYLLTNRFRQLQYQNLNSIFVVIKCRDRKFFKIFAFFVILFEDQFEPPVLGASAEGRAAIDKEACERSEQATVATQLNASI